MNIKESQFYKDFNKTSKLTKDLDKVLNSMDNCFENKNILDAYEYSLKLVDVSEKIVNSARLMPISSGAVMALDDIEKVILDNCKIEIDYIKNNWFYLKIPALLPKKEIGSVSYIRATVKTALDNYFKSNKRIVIDDKLVIVFKHNYSKNRSLREYRDHDNIEINAIVDLVTLYVMIDDTSAHCSHYYFSSAAAEDSTEVFVVPQKDFIEFISIYNK